MSDTVQNITCPEIIKLSLAVAILLSVFGILLNPAWSAPEDLEIIYRDVVDDYPSVRHIAPGELATIVGGDKVILFDVRTPDEYNVSRLIKAAIMSPQTSVAKFLRNFQGEYKDKIVVFYCAVGVRSSKMAERLQQTLSDLGVRDVYNLKGGIFAWHNEERALENNGGASNFVHPYGRAWENLLRRPNLVRYDLEP